MMTYFSIRQIQLNLRLLSAVKFTCLYVARLSRSLRNILYSTIMKNHLMQFKPKLTDCKIKFIFVYVFAVFAHMIIMFVPVRPPCPACLRVHCLQTKMQIHDRVSGFSRKIEQIIDPAPLVTNPVEKFIFPAKRFHLARRHLPLQRLQARQDEVGFVKQNFQKIT